MNPHDFIPEVWTCPGWPAMLVCGRRWYCGNKVEGAPVKTTFESIHHVVAIKLLAPPVVCFGFRGGDGDDETWTRYRLGIPGAEQFGIPARPAALALAEAWRCVKFSQNPRDFSLTGRINLEKAERRGAAIRRNILIWLAWGSWKARGVTLEQARAEIEAQGFTLTPKAFNRLLEDAGMSI